MTQNSNFKRRVRARAAKTGESYAAAFSRIRRTSPSDPAPEAKSVRLAVAQTTVYDDPRNIAGLRVGGLEMRCLMREAHEAGARLVHFPEGTICSPNKRIMSVIGPEQVGPADWRKVEWAALREELDATRKLARELGLWTIFGSVHQLTPPHRPHNSLYVVSDRGELMTRYDERMLSNTKVSFMYTPGSVPVTFEVDGFRFGCALGMESHFPEIFIEYERLGVDCVLFSTTGESSAAGPAFAAEALGHAASNTYWVSFSAHAPQSLTAPSGIAAPNGQWAAQCPADGRPSIAAVDINDNPGNLARPWRRTARAGIYEPHLVKDDRRSDDRSTF
jgi:predicted amidohydrolase